jgi:hypothetical protein
LSVDPGSGQAGIQITISGAHLEQSVEFSIYWDPPTTLIGHVDSTELGQILPFTYTVPITVAVGTHQITAERDGSIAAETTFEVVGSNSGSSIPPHR